MYNAFANSTQIAFKGTLIVNAKVCSMYVYKQYVYKWWWMHESVCWKYLQASVFLVVIQLQLSHELMTEHADMTYWHRSFKTSYLCLWCSQNSICGFIAVTIVVNVYGKSTVYGPRSLTWPAVLTVSTLLRGALFTGSNIQYVKYKKYSPGYNRLVTTASNKICKKVHRVKRPS